MDRTSFKTGWILVLAEWFEARRQRFPGRLLAGRRAFP